MTEQQRRRRQRELRRRRLRRKRIAAVIVTAAVLVVVILAGRHAVLRRNKGLLAGSEGDIIVLSGAETMHAEDTAGSPSGEGTQAGSSVHDETSSVREEGADNSPNEAPAGDAASAAGEGAGDGGQTREVKTMTLTEDQKYTGDLILVSRSWPYDFERNSEEVQLVRILDAQSWSYPVGKEEFMLAKRVMKSLDAMIHDCDQYLGTEYTGISSAYRSKEYQQSVFEEAADEYGENYAESHVAYPGYSEHHTGLAADLGIFYDDGSEGSFTDSSNAEWMSRNCYKYGFIRRYAEDKTEITGISNESWHFRYVGLPHSVYMYENNLCLEEYLDYLKNNTSPGNPLVIEYNGETCSVFYTADSVVERPAHRFDVSGDNKGGYVITVHEG